MLLNNEEDLRGLLDEIYQSVCLGSYTTLITALHSHCFPPGTDAQILLMLQLVLGLIHPDITAALRGEEVFMQLDPSASPGPGDAGLPSAELRAGAAGARQSPARLRALGWGEEDPGPAAGSLAAG